MFLNKFYRKFNVKSIIENHKAVNKTTEDEKSKDLPKENNMHPIEDIEKESSSEFEEFAGSRSRTRTDLYKTNKSQDLEQAQGFRQIGTVRHSMVLSYNPYRKTYEDI